MSKLFLLLMLCSAVFLAASCARAGLPDDTYTVVKVADGDTLTVRTDDGKRLSVRLASIDAPETKQSYGKESKADLARLTLNKRVTLRVIETDRYGRVVAVVYADKADVNLQMLELGSAWLYTDYTKWMDSKELGLYQEAEGKAKRYNRGLWSSARPLAPWSYRKQIRSKKPL